MKRDCQDWLGSTDAGRISAKRGGPAPILLHRPYGMGGLR